MTASLHLTMAEDSADYVINCILGQCPTLITPVNTLEVLGELCHSSIDQLQSCKMVYITQSNTWELQRENQPIGAAGLVHM